MARPSSIRTVPFINPAGSQSWRVTGTVDGKRIRENFSTKAEAEARRLELITSSLVGTPMLTTALTRLSPEQLADAESARVLLAQSGLEDVLLLRIVGEWIRTAPLARSETPIAEALGEFLAEKQAGGLRPETLDGVRGRLGDFVAAGLDTVSDFTADAARAYVCAEDVAPLTARTRRAHLHSFGGWLVRRGYLGSNPVDAVESPKVRWERPAILSNDQVDALLTAASETDGGSMLPYFALCVLSGVRPTEALRLTEWSDFDLEEHGHAYVSEKISKTASRYVPLCARLVAILKDCRARGLKPGVLNRRVFRRVRQVAGVGFLWRGPAADIMRHTYASHHYAAHKDLAALAHACANSAQVLKRHYIVALPEAEGRKFFEKSWKQNSAGHV